MAADTGAGPRRRRIGWACLAVQLPAMLASAGLLVVAAGPYSAWLLTAWVLSGLGVMSRTGERFMLRRQGFLNLNSRQQTQLLPVAAAALESARMRQPDIDWYVLRSDEPNAYAAGRRAVAVSTGMLDAFRSGRLSEPMIRGILVHELGHHATSATNYSLVAQWLAVPWRCLPRVLVGASTAMVGQRQPRRLLALVLIAAPVVALIHAGQRGDWVTSVTLHVLVEA